jgi:hypothetical protein
MEENKLSAMRSRIRQLELALGDLLNAGWHSPDCGIQSGVRPCDCGMEARYNDARSTLNRGTLEGKA